MGLFSWDIIVIAVMRTTHCPIQMQPILYSICVFSVFLFSTLYRQTLIYIFFSVFLFSLPRCWRPPVLVSYFFFKL